MQTGNFPSKLLEKAVTEFSKLPGVGSKTALRLILHLLRQDEMDVEQFSHSILDLKRNIKYCNRCRNISDSEICGICSNPRREGSTICVVENIKDVMSIENTHQYFGLYHVIGGIISPMDGLGPDDLEIGSLLERISKENIKEVILALRTTMEGDTTSFYIYKKIKDFDISLSTLSRGISVGGELDYIDEVTLGRSLINRTPFNPSF